MNRTTAALPLSAHERARFEAHYDAALPSACWLYRNLDGKGYGAFQVKRDGKWVSLGAHRLSYELHVGPVPDGLHLDHLCRNPECINPAHLEPVTNAENNRRGRSVSALNMRKTECVHGHALEGENLVVTITKGGKVHRTCRACTNKKVRRQKPVRLYPESVAGSLMDLLAVHQMTTRQLSLALGKSMRHIEFVRSVLMEQGLVEPAGQAYAKALYWTLSAHGTKTLAEWRRPVAS